MRTRPPIPPDAPSRVANGLCHAPHGGGFALFGAQRDKNQKVGAAPYVITDCTKPETDSSLP